MPAPAPLRPLNPFLLRRVERSGLTKRTLTTIGGFPHYVYFYLCFREERVRASPRTIERLERVAAAVGFPKDEIFLDEPTTHHRS